MTRNQQTDHNQQVIQLLTNLVSQHRWRSPAYRVVVALLNAQGLLTSRGNQWTPQRLFRMLQRNGYGGLHGLRQSVRGNLAD